MTYAVSSTGRCFIIILGIEEYSNYPTDGGKDGI